MPIRLPARSHGKRRGAMAIAAVEFIPLAGSALPGTPYPGGRGRGAGR
jgi:hypothetical protein